MTSDGNWLQLVMSALDRSTRGAANHFQLATVTPDGRAANRTLTFREFRHLTDDLCTHSHTRAQKVADLESNPQAEACWWFDEARDQFRISGSVQILTDDATGDDAAYRNEQWASLDRYEKALYISPDPGQPRADDASFNEAFSTTPPEDPPDTFAVLLLSPERVDHLDFSGHPHRRQVFTRTDDGWATEAVNP